MKLVKFGRDLVVSKITKQPIPFQVTLNITDACNLKCSYCYLNYHSRHKKEISTKEWVEIIHKLAKLGTRKINLSGGEPLLRKGIEEIIEAILENDIDCYLNTNGALVEKKINILKGIHCLAISLDGSEAVNDSVRGKGSHSVAVEALRVGRKNNIPLQIATVLGEHNLGELDYLLTLAKEFHARLNIMTEIPVREDDDFSSLSLSEKYFDVVRRIQEFKKKGEPITYSVKAWQNFLDWPHDQIDKDFVLKNEELPKSYIRCQAGNYFCVIDTDGDLYPCCSLIDIIPAKNVLVDGLEECLKHVSMHPCRACSFPHNAEMNLLFSLDPSVIRNLFKIY